jgi:hypothetical protein
MSFIKRRRRPHQVRRSEGSRLKRHPFTVDSEKVSGRPKERAGRALVKNFFEWANFFRQHGNDLSRNVFRDDWMVGMLCATTFFVAGPRRAVDRES